MADQRTERERQGDYRCPSCGFAPRATVEASHAADCPQQAGVTREQLDAAQATLEMLRDEVTDALTQYGEGTTEHLAARERVARQHIVLADLQKRAAREAADEPARTGSADEDEPAVFVVINLATSDDENRVLGTLRCVAENTVEYIDTDGGLRSAPTDCVSVVRVVY